MVFLELLAGVKKPRRTGLMVVSHEEQMATLALEGMGLVCL
jgi:hypothetical protein